MSKQFLKIRSGTSYPGLSADPSDPQNGDLYYNTISNVFRQYINGSWANVGTSSTSGTVTSVALSVPSFLSVSGSPITSSGTLAVTLSGTALPILNGGTGQTTASAAFNALSPITSTGDLILGTGVNTAGRLGIGSTGNVLTVSGGTAIWAPPATSGTVTSVALTVPSFLSVSGSPITSSGTLAVTLSGTALPIANGGTGQTSKTAAFDALSPMSASGDIIYGGVSGTGTALAKGSDGQVLTLVSGLPAWSTSSGSTTNGMISNNASAGNITISTGTSLFIPYLTIGVSDTYTVSTGSQLVSVDTMTVNGTLTVNGTGIVKII